MAVHQAGVVIPTWAVVLLIGLVGVSFAIGLSVAQSLAVPVGFWLSLVPLGLALYVVYLFYRLVVAVETIAQRL